MKISCQSNELFHYVLNSRGNTTEEEKLYIVNSPSMLKKTFNNDMNGNNLFMKREQKDFTIF